MTKEYEYFLSKEAYKVGAGTQTKFLEGYMVWGHPTDV